MGSLCVAPISGIKCKWGPDVLLRDSELLMTSEPKHICATVFALKFSRPLLHQALQHTTTTNNNNNKSHNKHKHKHKHQHNDNMYNHNNTNTNNATINTNNANYTWYSFQGGCSRRGVQWMGVVSHSKTACNVT